MQDLELRREQHAAALSYLDTETLALTDILAALDDAPAAPNGTRRPRVWRLVRWGAGIATMATAATMGALILAPNAQAASPFDNPLYRTVHASGNWQCVSENRREQTCVSSDGTVHSDVVANEGPDSTTFEATFTHNGKVVRTEITAFDPSADEAADVTSLRTAMRADPTVYPNVREGVGWLLWSTDAKAADHVANILHAQPPVKP